MEEGEGVRGVSPPPEIRQNTCIFILVIHKAFFKQKKHSLAQNNFSAFFFEFLTFMLFLTKLGLDARITSWDLKNRIPRPKLPLY